MLVIRSFSSGASVGILDFHQQSLQISGRWSSLMREGYRSTDSLWPSFLFISLFHSSQSSAKANSWGTISKTKGSAKGSLSSFALPLEEDLAVEDVLVLEEAVFEELPLTEEETVLFVKEPRLQSLPPLLLDLVRAIVLLRSLTIEIRRG